MVKQFGSVGVQFVLNENHKNYNPVEIVINKWTTLGTTLNRRGNWMEG